MKILFLSSGIVDDFDAEVFVMLKDFNVKGEYDDYNEWYKEVYCKQNRNDKGKILYKNFSQWLIEAGLVRKPIDGEEVVYFHE